MNMIGITTPFMATIQSWLTSKIKIPKRKTTNIKKISETGKCYYQQYYYEKNWNYLNKIVSTAYTLHYHQNQTAGKCISSSLIN